MDYKENSSFCVLPFIHKHKRLSGSETLCCFSQVPVNKNSIQNIRKKILEGERVKNCETCYKQEERGLISHRIKENKRWLDDPEVKNYIDNYSLEKEEVTYSYDLRYSNICNLACIGCMPQQSSLWAKELNIAIKPIDFKFDIASAKKAKWIYMAGGEPFLTDELVELLKNISTLDEQPFICINTNLTVQDDNVKKICEKLKSLTLHISIDGINKVAEYHRWPIKWEKFERNLQWAKDLNCNIMFNTVVDAVNVSFIHEILPYENYVSNWSLISLLQPTQLRIENLPNKHKQNAYDNFTKMKSSKYYQQDVYFKTNVDAILNKILEKGSPDQLSEFIKKLDGRRNINHQEFIGINLIDF